MKRILITGEDSYIGTSFQNWLLQYPEAYITETIDMREDSWKEKDFSKYDVVFHVAGLAHVSTDPKLEGLYYKVNRDLAIEAAIKAKDAGIKQFIFMSSIIVYGDNNNDNGVINFNTIPSPTNFYGKSKLQAEQGILSKVEETFKVVVLRPPMIYGKGSKGNYPRLSGLARMLPLFPDFSNRRSMLYITNLCEFIRLMIDHEESGLFFPQNAEYVETSHMVVQIAQAYGKRIKLTKLFNPLIRFLINKVGIVSKIFGNLAYEQSISVYKESYQVKGFQESILLTEEHEADSCSK